MAARPNSLAGSSTVAAAKRMGAAWCIRSKSNARAMTAGWAGTTAGVNRSTAAASVPSHGARTRTPVSWSSAPERSSTVEPERSACRQYLRVRLSVPQKKEKSACSKASELRALMKVTSSPTWSNWPCASSSSSKKSWPMQAASRKGHPSARGQSGSRPRRWQSCTQVSLFVAGNLSTVSRDRAGAPHDQDRANLWDVCACASTSRRLRAPRFPRTCRQVRRRTSPRSNTAARYIRSPPATPATGRDVFA